MKRTLLISVQMWKLEMYLHMKTTAAWLSGLTVGKSGSIWAPWSVMSIFSSPWLQRTRSRDALLHLSNTGWRCVWLWWFSFFSLAQFPPPPLQFTGRVFSNGGSAAFPLLPYIIYARKREAALPFTRIPIANAEATRRSRHTCVSVLIAICICAHLDICNVDAD